MTPVEKLSMLAASPCFTFGSGDSSGDGYRDIALWGRLEKISMLAALPCVPCQWRRLRRHCFVGRGGLGWVGGGVAGGGKCRLAVRLFAACERSACFPFVGFAFVGWWFFRRSITLFGAVYYL